MRLAIIQLEAEGSTSGVVCNIIEVTTDTALGITLPLDQLSWDCSNTSVSIGDRWEDGVFSRDGGPLVPVPTDAEKIAELEAQMAALLGVETEVQA